MKVFQREILFFYQNIFRIKLKNAKNKTIQTEYLRMLSQEKDRHIYFVDLKEKVSQVN